MRRAKAVKAPEPKADPALVRDLDATINSTLRLQHRIGKIDHVDAAFLLVRRLPEWLGTQNERFALDLVRGAFESAREKESKK